jgi:hypothetical protein
VAAWWRAPHDRGEVGRLHDYFARQAGVDIDQAGLAVLYVLHGEKTALRITDLAGRLSIDARR